MMKQEIKAVLFDLDGTVTDTERFYFACWPQSFHAFGYTDYGPEDALYARSLNHEDANAHWKERFHDPNIPMEEIRAYNNRLVQDMTREQGVRLKPGVREILAFTKAHGIASAVVTATRQERAEARIKEAGLAGAFDRIISASMVKKGKPHPDVYAYACRTLGFDSKNCMAVEDSPNGVRSAAAAGCLTVMVPDLTQPDEDLLPLLHASVSDLTKLIPLICAYNGV